MLNAGAGGVAQQLEHAGAAQHAVLRKRDDLHRECAVVVRGRLANRLDAAQPESEVDVDVRAHRGRAVRDELLEHVAGDLRRWHPDLVAPGTLVPDVPLGAALAAVGQVDGGVAPGRTLRSRGGVAKVTTLVSRPAALPAVQSTASRVIT